MNTKLSLSFWNFVFPVTVTVSLVIAITIHNSIKHIDMILLELYLTGELEDPIEFTYKGYLEELESSNEFIDVNHKTINDTDNSRIHKNPIQWISKLRGGKNFRYSLNNWKNSKPLNISRTGVKMIAITLVCGTAGLTTVYLVQSINELKKLTPKDIAIIKNCIHSYCKVHKINFLQLPFNKKLWESFLDAVSLCIESNLEFKITRQQYFIIVGLLKVLKNPSVIPIFTFLMCFTFSLGIVITGATIYLIASGNLILATLISSGWASILMWDIIANQSLLLKEIIGKLVKIIILVNQLGKQPQLPVDRDFTPILPSSSYPSIENLVPRIDYETERVSHLEEKPNPYSIYDESQSLSDILNKYYSEQAPDSIEKSDLPTIEYNPEPSVEDPNP